MFSKKYQYYLLFILTLTTLLAWWAVYLGRGEGEFRVVFFDVGQGDATFIQDQAGHQILIDGGEGDLVLDKLGEILPFFDRSLDLVILTHPHRDHVEGLVSVLKRYKVDLVLYTGVEYTSPYYQEFEELLLKKKIIFAFSHHNQRISLADGAYIDILFPWEAMDGKEVENLNNTSIVCRLVRGPEEYLLVGDAEKEVEAELIQNNVYLQSDVLRVGHHGSKTSSTVDFLRAVEPEVAIISVGKENRFNHPHQDVLERLENFGIEVFRTDLEGDIAY